MFKSKGDELKWMITIYIVAFILITIISVTRLIFGKISFLEGGSNIYFGIKNIWGYLHFILYTVLGYKCGIELLPLILFISISWDLSEWLLDKITKGIINASGPKDTFIDMNGYLFGLWLYYLKYGVVK